MLQSSPSFLSGLPDELLLLICEETLSLLDEFGHPLKTLSSLSCVSKRWNRIAMTPSLWATVHITPNDLLSSTICVARSQNLPLDVIVDFGFACCEADPSRLLTAFDSVLKHVRRWRSLRLSARRHYLRALLFSLESVSAPKLEELYLAQCEMDFSPVDIGPIFDVFVGELPSLRSLRTFGFIPITQESFAQPSLQNLEIVRALDHPLEWDQFLDFLTAPSNLTTLTISTGRAGLLPDVSYPIIDLPKLRTLRLTFGLSTSQSTILRVLHAPNLETLEISWISDWGPFLDSLESLCDCHMAKFPNVTSLTLRMIGYTPSFEDYRLFGTFPNLVTLTLDDIEEVEPFFDALSSPWVSDLTREVYYAWPKLQSIILTGTSHLMIPSTIPTVESLIKTRIIGNKAWPLAVVRS